MVNRDKKALNNSESNYTSLTPIPLEHEDSFNILNIFLNALKFRGLIVCISLLFIAAGLMVTLMQAVKYQATLQLEILVPMAKVFQDLEIIDQATDLRAFLTTREKLKSRAVAKHTIAALGLADKTDFIVPKPAFSAYNLIDYIFGNKVFAAHNDIAFSERETLAIKRIIDDLDVTLVANTSLLALTFRDQNPVYARDVVNQIVASFITQRVEQTGRTSNLARDFIQAQVQQIKSKLQISETELVAYAKNAGLTISGTDNTLIFKNIETLNAALTAAIQERLDYGRLVQQINAGQGESLSTIMENLPLQQLRMKIVELSADYKQKLSSFKPGFPEMVQLRAHIDELKKQLTGAIRAIETSIKIKYEELQIKEIELKNKIQDLDKQQSEYQDKNIHYTILKREVDSNRSQYDSLMSKLNEIGISTELKNQSAVVVDAAILPVAPYSPRLLLNLFIALALSLLTSAAIIYILELLNNKFRSPEKIEEALGIPLLGILPFVAKRDLTVAIDDPQSALSEAYRSLRTSLQFTGKNGAPKTLLVTSSEISEGKSTTSLKLAVDFAALKQKILVIDADMRRPTLHRIFNCDNATGLSDYLNQPDGKDDITQFCRVTKYSNVSLITAGLIATNPADLLSSAKMVRVLKSLSEKFDMIIIDSAPVIGLADAPILGRMVDGTLLIVSGNQVSIKAARIALKRLKVAGSVVVGACFSKFIVSKFDNNQAYSYMNYNYVKLPENKKS